MDEKHCTQRFWLRFSQIGILIVLFILSFWFLNLHVAAGNASYDFYLPYIVTDGQVCEQEHLVNGNFEQDDFGWQLYSNGWGWKIHDLIGSKDDGFSPFNGDYAARLGGFEGVQDYIEQIVVIPETGQLTYWWKMGTSEPLPHTDGLGVFLLEIDHTRVALLESHDDQDVEGVWQQDVIDLTEFAGRRLILRFSVYNDNYYATGFDLDEIQLCSWTE